MKIAGNTPPLASQREVTKKILYLFLQNSECDRSISLNKLTKPPQIDLIRKSVAKTTI